MEGWEASASWAASFATLTKRWTRADRGGVRASRVTLAAACIYEAGFLLLASSAEDVDLLDLLDTTTKPSDVWRGGPRDSLLDDPNAAPASFPAWVLIVQFGSLLALLMGWHPRFAAVVALLMQGRMYVRLQTTMYGGAKLQLLGLFGHALTSEATPRETGEEREKPSSGFGVAFTRLGTCAMYVASGANKLLDEDWRRGTAVRKTLACVSVVHHPAISNFVVKHLPDAVGAAATWSSMALEVIAPILIVVATSAGLPDAAVLTVAALVVFHVCLGATITVGTHSPFISSPTCSRVCFFTGRP